MKRPVSLTAVACFLIATGVFGASSIAIGNPELRRASILAPHLLPLWAMAGFGFLEAAVKVAAGIAILRRREWSRRIYIAVSVLGLAIGYVTLPLAAQTASVGAPWFLFQQALIFILVVYLLYAPPAGGYFSPARAVRRPISLSIGASLLIVSSVLAITQIADLVSSIEAANFLAELRANLAPLALATLLSLGQIAIGVAILRGRGWSRHAFIAILVLYCIGWALNGPRVLHFVTDIQVSVRPALSLMLAAINSIVLPSLLLTLFFVYLLYRRSATSYFRQSARDRLSNAPGTVSNTAA